MVSEIRIACHLSYGAASKNNNVYVPCQSHGNVISSISVMQATNPLTSVYRSRSMNDSSDNIHLYGLYKYSKIAWQVLTW